MHQPRRCEYYHENENNSPNTKNDKNYSASSEDFGKAQQLYIRHSVI